MVGILVPLNSVKVTPALWIFARKSSNELKDLLPDAKDHLLKITYRYVLIVSEK
jgi:hypothetical protein